MMDNSSGHDQMELPPGFRFHPTDEELITHYLSKKVVNRSFSAKAIGEVDMNKIEPWELPRMAKMGEKEWYFFCVRDKKYPTGLRTNRATAAGYWKATGKDKEIFRGKSLVGMKKTLVFYKGRAPKGEKSNWVIHEFRLEGKFSLQNLPKSTKNEWVICRVFHKSSGGSKVQVMSSGQNQLISSSLPPLTDSPAAASGGGGGRLTPQPLHVPCFSNSIEIQTHMVNNNNNSSLPLAFNPNFPANYPRINLFSSGLLNSHPVLPMHGSFQFPQALTFPVNDQAILRDLIDHYGQTTMKQDLKLERDMATGSQETGLSTEINTEISSNLEMGKPRFEDQEAQLGPLDVDLLWNY